MDGHLFNPAPGWPKPPVGWVPPANWKPDGSWPAAPPDWSFWTPIEPAPAASAQSLLVPPTIAPPPEVDHPSPAVGNPLPPPAPSPSPAATRDDGVEIAALRSQVALLQSQLSAAAAGPPDGNAELVDLDDERVLQEVGIYRYHHPLENSEEFRDRLNTLQEKIKQFVLEGEAILKSDMFTFNNSLAKGRKMTSDFGKLMLRAYNSEADSCVRSLRAGNVVTAERRLEASVTSIAKLGAMMEMRVNPEYHALRIDELHLTADFAMKVQEERERAREEREHLREQRKVEQELAAERERLDKERAHYANAMQALLAGGDESGAAELAAKLGELEQAIAQNDYRAANIRAGYVYVISNIGAFGPNMVKIGMTRRLEPLDRVKELGDASVPFPFDVHAIYFSDDAVTLENELHHAFAEARVNRVNDRREFFFAAPTKVRDVLADKLGNLLEFTEVPESTQYRQSKGYWPEST
ncbi:MAG: putative helicase [Acidimicrobiales bacterium]|nr:putative helicase [Acidimicrobiales bacterium]